MRAIKTQSHTKENTQGRHYTPNSLLSRLQVLDPFISPLLKNVKTKGELRKLG
jgi:hypothetical protein